ncbi:MAG: VCBS repeat-containing protein [Cyclobacteriaceae bacterium]
MAIFLSNKRFLLFILSSLLWRASSHAQFLEVSADAGIDPTKTQGNFISGGVAFFDFNNDGFEDIYITGGGESDLLYENQGNGFFEDVSITMGLNALFGAKTMGVYSGDLDNDGFEDLIVTSFIDQRTFLLWNKDGIYFEEGGRQAGLEGSFWGSSVALGDYNLDGHLDIYVCNYNEESTGDQLYTNNGDKTFTNSSGLLRDDANGAALVAAFTDIDLDGDPDLLLGNDFGYDYQPNKLFVNYYPKPFLVEQSEASSWNLEINTMGFAVGDIDEDGDFDYYVSDIGDNFLFINEGDLKLEEKAHDLGVEDDKTTSWGVAFFDYNNDTYLDLYISNGELSPIDNGHVNKLFQGDGVSFVDVSSSQEVGSPFTTRGLAIGDYNNDGNLDILGGTVFKGGDRGYHTLLYQNQSNQSNWLKVKLQGNVANRSGIGAFIKVVIGERSFIRELTGGGSYLSHHSKTIHFGLGEEDNIDSLIVKWPGGNVDVFKDLNINQTYLVSEKKELFHWISERKVIASNETIILEGKEVTTSGIYTDTLQTDGAIRTIRKTRLFVDENLVIELPLDNAFDPFEETLVSVSPNPFDGAFQISFGEGMVKNGSRLEMKLLNAAGQMILKANGENRISEPLFVKNLKELPPGMYYLIISVENKTYSQKLIKR